MIHSNIIWALWSFSIIISVCCECNWKNKKTKTKEEEEANENCNAPPLSFLCVCVWRCVIIIIITIQKKKERKKEKRSIFNRSPINIYCNCYYIKLRGWKCCMYRRGIALTPKGHSNFSQRGGAVPSENMHSTKKESSSWSILYRQQSTNSFFIYSFRSMGLCPIESLYIVSPQT